MEKHIITKEQLDDQNFYVGAVALTDFNGHIEIDANLGWVRFKAALSAKGWIFAKAGSGIKAGEGIEAGSGIEAGWGIKAGEGIEAGSGIKAGEGIKAGSGIKAGEGIEAGSGIVAHLAVRCRKALSVGLRIFAGVCSWRSIEPAEMEIECGKLVSGEIAFGTLIERGIPEEEATVTKSVTFHIGGREWSAGELVELRDALASVAAA